MPIKVIDLFAGPGGLGEGFSAYRSKEKQAFKIAISIEKEKSAHRTLHLRALFRQFDQDDMPEAYYAFLRGELGKSPEDELYQLPELRVQLERASQEAQKLTLGQENSSKVDSAIHDAIGTDECILIGGPPCQAYSLAGRSRNYGDKKKQYIAAEDHRNFLYLEYLKTIAQFQPMVFVMENVKGMLSAKVNEELIYESIIRDLQDPYKTTGIPPATGRQKHRYKIFSLVKPSRNFNQADQTPDIPDPHDFIIRSEDYGIPQNRHRVILLGIREDIASSLGDFKRLEPHQKKLTVKQVISDLPKLRSRLSKGKDSVNNWRDAIKRINDRVIEEINHDSLVIPQVSDRLISHVSNIQDSPEDTGADKGIQKTALFSTQLPITYQNWYHDQRIGRFVTNHEARGHIEGDLHRYLYYSSFAEINQTSPNSHNLPKVLWPNHKNFSTGKFADRFRVQLPDMPGTTVTSHISKDGHYFIHYDPTQCRSLTVREAARIQTFPDNYYFVGNRTQQYVQVGNAVPPLLAKQIAHVIYKILN